jgi:hypothetical protein
MCEDLMERTSRKRARPIKAIRPHPGDQQTVDAARANRRAAVTNQVARRLTDLIPLSPGHRARLALLLLRSAEQATSDAADRTTSSEVRSGRDLTGRNQVFGFVLALIAFGGAIALTVLGMPDVGALFLSAPVVALIFAFVVRR